MVKSNVATAAHTGSHPKLNVIVNRKVLADGASAFRKRKPIVLLE